MITKLFEFKIALLILLVFANHSFSMTLERFHIRPTFATDDLLKDYDGGLIFVSSELENLMWFLRKQKREYNVFSTTRPDFPSSIFFQLPLTWFESQQKIYLFYRNSEKSVVVNGIERLVRSRPVFSAQRIILKELSADLYWQEKSTENIYTETANIKDVNKYVDKKTVVFLDYDETIFMPLSKDMNGMIDRTVEKEATAPVINDIAEKSLATFILTNRSYAKDDAFKSVNKRVDKIYEKSEAPIPIDFKMNLELRKNGIIIPKRLLLTQEHINSKMLQVHGVTRGIFSNIIFSAATGLAWFAQNNRDAAVTIKDFLGIPQQLKIDITARVNKPITSHSGKAITALEFINASRLKPEKVVFVDDTKEIATTFHSLMKKFRYNSVVIEYQGSDQPEYIEDLTSVAAWITNLSDSRINKLEKINQILTGVYSKQLDELRAMSLVLDIPDLSATEQTDTLFRIAYGDEAEKGLEVPTLSFKQSYIDPIFSAQDRRKELEVLREKMRQSKK